MARLRVTTGPSTGKQVHVQAELLLGREGVDLVIEDPEMSRRHAAVRLVGGVLEVEDLGSANGTFVNGERIEGPTLVNGGGQIRCGTTVFEVLGVVPAQGTRLRTDTDTDTDAAPIADPQATRARAIADPQATRVRPIADPQATAPRSIPRPRPPPAGHTPAAAAPGTTGLPAPVGTFSPPVQRRSRGLASRSWVPTALSFGTVIVVAVALVIYFATR
jgi:pSer/pThr/pTyr-binding forkhead associated (FHA) protein